MIARRLAPHAARAGVLSTLAFLVPLAPALRTVLGGATGPALIPVLQQTGLAELVWAALVAAALIVCG